MALTYKDLEGIFDSLPIPEEDYGDVVTDKETALKYGKGMVLVQGSQMPPFIQTTWVSEKAKAVWSPRLELARRTYSVLERYTVLDQTREVFTTHIRPENMPDEMYSLAQSGLYFLPLTRVGSYEGFSHYHPPVQPGRPWSYYGVLGNPEATREFARATRDGDHDTMGRLLGYPSCCRDFFNEVWRRGYIDPVWQQAAISTMEEGAELVDFDPRSRTIFLKAKPETLPILRYIGIRAAPHIPHSVTCGESVAFSRRWRAVAEKYRDEIKELHGIDPVEGYDATVEILSWPIKWTVLHGIAEVKTPVFKFATNSSFTPYKYTVMFAKQDEVDLPEETPYALEFPFKRRMPMFKIDAPKEGDNASTEP